MTERWNWFDWVMIGFTAFFTMAILVTIAGTAYAVWSTAHAEMIGLRKDSWTCTAAHDERQTGLFGKVPLAWAVQVCDRWERRNVEG